MGLFDELGKKVTNTGQKTMQITKEFSESAKLKSMIGDEEKKIKNACYEIGKIYVSLHNNDYESDFAAWMAIVNESEQKIESYKRQIEAMKAVKRCSCGAELIEGMAFCAACGAPVQKQEAADEVKCMHCGKPIKKDANFCIHCGMAVEKVQNVEKPEISPADVVTEQICSACGAKQALGTIFCTQCGNKMTENEKAQEVQEKIFTETIMNQEEEAEEDLIPEVEMEPEPQEEIPAAEEKVQRCQKCGEVLMEGVNFCIHCGTPIHEIEEETVPEVKMETIQEPDGNPELPDKEPIKEQICPVCKSKQPSDALFCMACGSKMQTVPENKPEPAIVKCSKCGGVIQEGMLFCVYCGTPVNPSGANTEPAKEEPVKMAYPKYSKELDNRATFGIYSRKK
ncbi:MAG: zinc-ribbon domain-containing protein [Blautia sp.]